MRFIILITSCFFAFASFCAVGYFLSNFSDIISVTSSFALALSIVDISTLNGLYFLPSLFSIVFVFCFLNSVLSTLSISAWLGFIVF